MELKKITKKMKQYNSSKKQKGIITDLPAINQSKLGHYQFISKEEGVISTQQFESFYKALKHSLPKDTLLIQRVFVSRPVTSKPLEVRMGKGKGNIDGYRVKIKINQILIEISNIKEGISYKSIFERAIARLSFKTIISGGEVSIYKNAGHYYF